MAKSLKNVTQLVADLELEKVASVVQESLDGGAEALKVLQAMSKGMIQVGKLFEQGEYYLADLVLAGDVLARLDDRDLRLEHRKWASQRAQLEKEYREALAGQEVAFDGNQSQPGSSPIASYAWDFGDGSTARGVLSRHTYPATAAL